MIITSVLRNSDFTPSLTPAKKEIIARMNYMPVTRIFLEVKNSFWEKRGKMVFP
ncbi:FAD-dependent oxidoreductase [Dyadobacter bucti]|uniref:FAD-dependent oxidoreductase n=1 Tax=Dyadobacter bucti TaxID=2572203 RepID=UPI001107D387